MSENSIGPVNIDGMKVIGHGEISIVAGAAGSVRLSDDVSPAR